MYQQIDKKLLNTKKIKMKKNKNVMISKHKSTPIFKKKTILTMKKLMLLVLTCLFFVPLSGQKGIQQTVKNQLKESSQWQPYVPRAISVKQFIENKQDLGLSENNELKEVSKKTSKNGIVHSKNIQTVNDIPVTGTLLLTHQEGNQLIYNGHFVPGLSLDTNPTLNEEDALQKALASMQIKLPSWENQDYENLLKTIKNDPTATNYPKGELVIYDNNYSKNAENYNLAYKFQIYSIEPLSNKTVYVDAHSGNILGSIENMHNCTETCNLRSATGSTNYYETVSFEVCTDEEETYFLQHNLITTFTANNRNDLAQICIESEDSIFEENPTANEVYWASHQYYDFLLNTFGRKSIDDKDHALVAIVNYGENSNNAGWDGYLSIFGDGDGQLFNALTSLDIVAHEFTHGLNDYTADLIYRNESGALDESFADIFGILLEHYTYGETDWQIGDQITLQHYSLRNFVNPKVPGQSHGPYPNTYRGEYWISKNGKDNGGVHYNSSVQNYWFYLLCEGGSGVNDNGYAYNIEGIGIENATKIVYENLTNHLFPTAEFADAQEGAIQAAKDIFGDDSFEAGQTRLAWCAVGLGECASACDRALDSLALVAFYYSTNGDNWDIPWDFTKPMDEWAGVTLNENGCVKRLHIYWNNLTGTIPPEIGNLSSLEELTLAITPIAGEIPKEIGLLTNLKILNLIDLELTGNIPSEISNLTKLESLIITANLLEGTIPSEIGKLNNLKVLNLSANHLTGEIPIEIYNLITLEELDLGGVSYLYPELGLTGSLQKEIGNLINLKKLSLGANRLTGKIPDEIGNLDQLEILALFYNNFEGEIPITIGQLKKIKSINLGFNNFSGSVPFELALLDSLTNLSLDHNSFTGTLPPELCDLENLVELMLSFNQLTGCYPQCFNKFCNQLDIVGNFGISNGNNFDATWEDFCATGAGQCAPPETCNDKQTLIEIYNALGGSDSDLNWDLTLPIDTWQGVIVNEFGCVIELNFYASNLNGTIPPSIGNLKYLKYLNLLSNNIFGDIPAEIGNLVELEKLYLSNNDLTGVIPPEIGNLVKLESLLLNDNDLTGVIPPEIGNLVELELLELHTNTLTGQIPTEIGNLIKLKQMLLYENELTGEIPPSIGNLVRLNELKMYGNNLTGTIPPEIGNLTELVSLSFSRNSITGSIPSEIGNLIELEEFSFGDNMLIGEIPVEIGNLTKLTSLSLYKNELTGEIPASIGNLVLLDFFDLSDNQLTGNIPPELCNLSITNVLRLHGNQLEGCYPACLKKFCTTTYSVTFGRGLDATWEDFCATGAGTCSDAFVLPGDFNNDGCLSYVDVLYWGLAEGNTGPTRENATNDWIPQISTDWEADVNGINGKHQDAKSDGIVDINDVIVFVNNFEIDSTRCYGAVADNVKIEQDYPDYISLKPIESVNNKEESFEIFFQSKIENIGLQMHGFEFQVVIKGYEENEIEYINLETTPFKAAVEVVDTLIYLGNKEYLYKAAVTRFDNTNSKFDRNGAGAILVIGIEDVPTGIAREIDFKPSGLYLYASANAVPLSLQSTHMYINKEYNFTVNIVPSNSKGSLEVFVQTENGTDTFTIDNYPFAVGPTGIPSENTFRIDIDNSSGQGYHVIISDDNGFASDIINSDCLPKCPPRSSIPLPLFPNPATDIVQFDLAYIGHCGQKVQQIEIFDVTGFLVQTIQANKQGNCTYQIDVNDLPTGIYFINMMSGDKIWNGKFMKQ